MKDSITVRISNYKAIDIIKYISALLVICIHCNPLTANDPLNYFITQIVCRIAVPFFFISSAYFVRKGIRTKPDYLKHYLKKLILSYLAWSILFIPIGLDWIHQNLSLSQNLLPFALIFGLIHVGTYYHLWYIPALIISLFVVDKLLKKISYKTIIFISVMLFLFGSIESYYGLLPGNWLKNFFDIVIQVFFTTRSGLLYGMIFIVIGFFIYDYQEKLKPMLKHITLLTILSGSLVVLEGIFLYSVTKLDMNFLISLIPFSFFFFLRILSFPIEIKSNTGKIREWSKYYYFTHTICIVIIEEIGEALHIPVLRSGFLSFLLITFFTHTISLSVISIRKHPLKFSRITISALIGTGITFIIASLVYYFKPESIMIKFEFVPCLWIAASIAVYFLLHQLKMYLPFKNRPIN